ncbi:hypothetical protein H6P81_002156 [Aristolochia fimbriata]|uniref:Secreted protein n=1 Tax=Aristolochia fimbriata TaxID=158543 RepID=A0AAV7F9P7_ARIFI|nr:hypothetical protein H6P81_002156 [Aristolochia fimbriata]
MLSLPPSICVCRISYWYVLVMVCGDFSLFWCCEKKREVYVPEPGRICLFSREKLETLETWKKGREIREKSDRRERRQKEKQRETSQKKIVVT